MSRTLYHLAELQPELFAELSVDLGRALSIQNGDWVTVVTPRGAVQARAAVTPRTQTLTVDGREVHQVGLPFHWGYSGLVKGGSANDLVAISEEPNVHIMESKALTCAVLRGDRASNAATVATLVGVSAGRPS
jgi:formate dehydrogenase major subunit